MSVRKNNVNDSYDQLIEEKHGTRIEKIYMDIFMKTCVFIYHHEGNSTKYIYVLNFFDMGAKTAMENTKNKKMER